MDAEEQGQGQAEVNRKVRVVIWRAACNPSLRRPRDAVSSAPIAAIWLRTVHGCPAAVGPDDREGGVETALLAESDGLLELGELGVGRRGQCLQLFVPEGVVSGERSEAIDRGGDDGMGSRVGLQVSLVASEEVAALAGLGVPEFESTSSSPARVSWLTATADQELRYDPKIM